MNLVNSAPVITTNPTATRVRPAPPPPPTTTPRTTPRATTPPPPPPPPPTTTTPTPTPASTETFEIVVEFVEESTEAGDDAAADDDDDVADTSAETTPSPAPAAAVTTPTSTRRRPTQGERTRLATPADASVAPAGPPSRTPNGRGPASVFRINRSVIEMTSSKAETVKERKAIGCLFFSMEGTTNQDRETVIAWMGWKQGRRVPSTRSRSFDLLITLIG